MNLFETNNNPVSKNDIKNYLNDSLSEKEKHALESDQLNDPFLADAMDGFEQFPNEINNTPKLQAITNKINYILGGVLLLFVCLGTWYTVDLFNEKKLPENKITKTVIKENKKPETTAQSSIKNNEIETKKEIIAPVKVKLIKPTVTKEKTIPFVREIVNLEAYKSSPEIYKQELKYDIAKVKIKTIAYYNFLAVDYSVIYIDDANFEEINLGTPASSSNKESYSINQDDNSLSRKATTKYTYKEYLKQSLKLLNEKKYKQAIGNFSVILNHYPNDVNAQFYTGFSHFNLENYSDAIPFFDQTMNNSFDFFFEDAQWYKAQSLEKYGLLKEAKKLYTEIIKANGFYSKQAKKK